MHKLKCKWKAFDTNYVFTDGYIKEFRTDYVLIEGLDGKFYRIDYDNIKMFDESMIN